MPRAIIHGKRTVSLKTPDRDMPNPTPEQFRSIEFEAIWECIKKWDIGVPEYYGGHTGATGSHVSLILNALSKENLEKTQEEMITRRLNTKGW